VGHLFDRIDDVVVGAAAAQVAAHPFLISDLDTDDWPSSSVRADMICPGVQKPHWDASWSQPFLAPVSLSASRSRSNRVVRAS
jgi:hypothetical protein